MKVQIYDAPLDLDLTIRFAPRPGKVPPVAKPYSIRPFETTFDDRDDESSVDEHEEDEIPDLC